MQKVEPLLLVFLPCSLLSCAPKSESITTGNGKPSRCGDTFVGVTTEKSKYEVAGATLFDFTIGKGKTEVTPEFQRIASEVTMNEDSKVKIACNAMEKSGGEPSDERFTYYLNLLGFLSSSPPPPSVEQRMAWAEKFPAPKAAQPQSPNPTAPQESLEGRLCTC